MMSIHFTRSNGSPMCKLLLVFFFPVMLFCGQLPPSHDETVVVPSLRGVTFIGNARNIRKSGLSTAGVSLSEVRLLDRPAFRKQISPYLGRPITFSDLQRITAKTSAFCALQHHPLVDVIVPEQDVTSGVIQIVVTEYRVGEIRARGNRWFSDKVVAAPISLQHGDTIDAAKLLSELDTANSNPFRRVDLVYQPSAQPGYTDLVLNTKDRFPLTAYTGFDNSGTPVTGRSRWNMGLTWGNALWHDQQVSYQFSSSDDFFSGASRRGASFLSNSLSWTVPVRGNDSVSVFGSYQKSVPNVGVDFGFTGRSGQASTRYNHTLPRGKRFIQSLQFGYDFKTTNNNLAFGGTAVSRTSTEIDQFPVAYAANLADRFGASSFTTSVTFSPGGMSPNNHSDDFQPAFGQSGISGAMSRYTYWRSDFTRLTKLPKQAVYALHLAAQTSSANLLYTEKLSAGGPDLLRGYDPNSVYGDRGLVMSNELRSPSLKPYPEHAFGYAQLYTFWDYGALSVAKSFAGEANSLSASSVGAGVRYEVRSKLTARVNYGRALIQLPNQNAAARNQFTDLALTLAF